MLFHPKGTTKCESVIPSERNNKKRKCCSFGKAHQKNESVVPGINVVPSERNSKMRKRCSFGKGQKKTKVLFLRKGIAKRRK